MEADRWRVRPWPPAELVIRQIPCRREQALVAEAALLDDIGQQIRHNGIVREPPYLSNRWSVLLDAS
jgi:hypothetical protein